jgi:hypothetical protein
MSLEDLSGADKGLAALVVTNPTSLDQRSEGDDHIRGVKNALLNTFGPMQALADSLPAEGQALTWDAAAGRYRPAAPPLSGSGVLALLVGCVMYRHSVSVGLVQANGQTLAKATFPELWTYAQGFLTADQAANPGLYFSVDANNFRVPNLSGFFIRGAGQVDGNHVAAALGAGQLDTNKSHIHLAGTNNGIGTNGAGAYAGGSAIFAANSSVMIAAEGGPEARPVNVALLPCIVTGRSS